MPEMKYGIPDTGSDKWKSMDDEWHNGCVTGVTQPFDA